MMTLARSLVCASAAVILVALTSYAQPPANWKKLTDRHNKCVAYVPPDWSIDSALGSANAPEHAAGILMNSNQTKERADKTWAFYKPNLEGIEEKGGRRMGLIKNSGKAVYYLVQAPGDGFVCGAFVGVDKAGDAAKYGPIVKQVAESIAPGH
jgi:hypothetical protein